MSGGHCSRQLPIRPDPSRSPAPSVQQVLAAHLAPLGKFESRVLPVDRDLLHRVVRERKEPRLRAARPRPMLVKDRLEDVAKRARRMTRACTVATNSSMARGCCNSSTKRTLLPKYSLHQSGHTSRREFLIATSLARRALSRWSRAEHPGARRPFSLRTTLTGADEPQNRQGDSRQHYARSLRNRRRITFLKSPIANQRTS